MSAIDSELAIDDEDQDLGSKVSPITNGSHFADIKRRMRGTKTPPQISETPGGSVDPTLRGRRKVKWTNKEDATRSNLYLGTKKNSSQQPLDSPTVATLTTTEERGTDQPTHSGQPEAWIQ